MLMEGLAVWSPELGEGMGTRGKLVNVLQHLMGYLKNHISSEDKQELLSLIEDCRQGLVPLIVPMSGQTSEQNLTRFLSVVLFRS